ncbi:PaaI family thioesterase [Streptomyces sp. NRAIS4]
MASQSTTTARSTTFRWQAVDITVVRAEPGLVRFAMPVRDHFVNHLGFLAGGILSTVVDAALASAVLSMVTPEV